MPFKNVAAALAALSLAAAPVAAQPARPALEPAAEQAEGSELRGRVYWLLPLLVVIALLTGILAGEDEPQSP